jgi:hypothetical protein
MAEQLNKRSMQLFVLDKSFEVVSLCDTFSSLIWTERYSGYGDFELYLPASMANINMFPRGFYLWLIEPFVYDKNGKKIETRNDVMIIEKTELSTDIEEGDQLIISGRSLESLLLRRVIPKKVKYESVDPREIIKTILNENIIKPSEPARKIPNFKIATDNSQPLDPKYRKTFEFDGDYVYDAIKTICDDYDLGFSLDLKSDDHWKTSYLVFSIVYGTDRSYEQTDNPCMVFSPKFDNLISSDTIEDDTEFFNSAYVASSEETKDNKTRRLIKYVANNTGRSGWDIRETFYTDSDAKLNDGNNNPRPDSDIYPELEKYGKDELKSQKFNDSFDAEIALLESVQYHRDYDIGDIIQFDNAYGVNKTARITEYVRNEDDNGYREYPTFEPFSTEGIDALEDSYGNYVLDNYGNTINEGFI